MSMSITSFRIKRLYGFRTINVEPIHNNKLILVGENGTGKSTVASLLFFTLTQQWGKMTRYPFESISITINNKEVEVTWEELTREREIDTAIRRLFPLRSASLLSLALRGRNVEQLLVDPEEMEAVARTAGLPRRMVADMLDRAGIGAIAASTHLAGLADFLKECVTDQVLYLPTFRRIEQDLSSILGELPREAAIAIERLKERGEGSGHIEFVGFGMDDVDKTIERKMSEIKDDVRKGLNELTGTYLRDVIRGTYRTADSSLMRELDPETIDAIFSRMDETMLPKTDQARLRSMISKFNEGAKPESPDDKVVVHFLAQLIKLHKAQEQNERDIREFVQVCNRYLTGKRMDFDRKAISIAIWPDRSRGTREPASPGGPIPMKLLSSGEKQIVSLFSHIYLSGVPSCFIIIDEPELSLGVVWQRRFLTDILATGRCNGIVAATHSPFIFDNDLDSYAHSLDEYMG